MNITSHMSKKSNQNLKNVKRAALIKYELCCSGLKLVDIANDLGITKSAVYRSIYGLSTVSRVDDWLKNNVGYKEEI
ncbi:MAG: hypothetical protein LUB59_06580 [Candidatus Gastranaerophilales bacterium]|nr:hypothetical protein [Candidatus Gastranaerophilales bacterium]